MQVRLNISEKNYRDFSLCWCDCLVAFGPKKRCLMDLPPSDQLMCLKKTLNHPSCLKIQHYQLMCVKKVTGNNKIAIQRKSNAP